MGDKRRASAAQRLAGRLSSPDRDTVRGLGPVVATTLWPLLARAGTPCTTIAVVDCQYNRSTHPVLVKVSLPSCRRRTEGEASGLCHRRRPILADASCRQHPPSDLASSACPAQALLLAALPVAVGGGSRAVAAPGPDLALVDHFVTEQMAAHRIPGLALAVIHGARQPRPSWIDGAVARAAYGGWRGGAASGARYATRARSALTPSSRSTSAR